MKTRRMTLCALFAALTAVCAQIAIPVGTVPVNLALLPVLMAAVLLPVRYAAASALLYVLMGAIGLPVFARLTGGPGVIIGPTGGYLLGYVLCAWIAAVLCAGGLRRWVAMTMGVAGCYLLGTAWLMFAADVDLTQAITVGVLTFLPGDGLKIAAACFLAKRLQPVLHT